MFKILKVHPSVVLEEHTCLTHIFGHLKPTKVPMQNTIATLVDLISILPPFKAHCFWLVIPKIDANPPLEGSSLQEHQTVEAYSMTGNGLYQQFMVMTGGWFIIVLTTLYSLHYIPYFPYSNLFWAPTHFKKIWKIRTHFPTSLLQRWHMNQGTCPETSRHSSGVSPQLFLASDFETPWEFMYHWLV